MYNIRFDYAYHACYVTEALASMGYTRSEIEDSLGQAKYDDVFATYLLLGRKTTDVSLGEKKKFAYLNFLFFLFL